MEPLEATLMDELLRDFSGDMLPPTPPSQRRRGGAPPPSCSSEERHRRSPGSAAAPPIMHPTLLDGPAAGSALEPFPAFVEEDLEWLSNKDAFPTLDTFDISASNKPSPPLPPPAAADPKRPSPVSVLDGVLPTPPPPPPPLQWALGRGRSKGRRRRRRTLQVFRPPDEAPPREKRRCWHCEAEETPQWRAGPHGPKTLCNACGVRYKSGRLLPEYRPANSPTFSSVLHSNSHRKVMEMRRKKEGVLPHTPAPSPATMTKKKGLLAV